MILDEIKTKLREMMFNRLELNAAEIDVDDDSGLFDDAGWGIDSVDVLDVVLGIEEIFGVVIKQDGEVREHFESLNTLAKYINSLLESK